MSAMMGAGRRRGWKTREESRRRWKGRGDLDATRACASAFRRQGVELETTSRTQPKNVQDKDGKPAHRHKRMKELGQGQEAGGGGGEFSGYGM
mmetsp:Transcript_27016/g.54890  ORF Transcript_27016/g.54890 Transcript_27016/m.54890 type:complete len:93 (-) Transcript_27016:882-1160(-)